MTYYLYKITNLLNNKIYIGVHSTKNVNDRYMGSSKPLQNAIRKYGKQFFKKEILEFFDTAAQMYLREKEIISTAFVLREDTYNLITGGNGGFGPNAWQAAQTDTARRKRKKSMAASKMAQGKNNNQYGTMWITNEIKNLKILKTETIPDGFRKGRIMPAGWGDNIRNKLKGRTLEDIIGIDKAILRKTKTYKKL